MKSDKTRGRYPIGVTYQKDCNKFRPRCGKVLGLGLYLTPEDAHKAWQKEKIRQAKTLQNTQSAFLIIKGLQRVIDKIQYDLDNNLETVDF